MVNAFSRIQVSDCLIKQQFRAVQPFQLFISLFPKKTEAT